MEGGLVAFAVRVTGLGWVWEKIDGAKTYIGAVAEILTGLGAMVTAAGAELNLFVGQVHGIADLWNFAQALVKNPGPAALALLAGWGVVLHGWGVMAKKHAEDKRHAELLAAAAAPAPAPVSAPNGTTPSPTP